jgi:hypothetical protein
LHAIMEGTTACQHAGANPPTVYLYGKHTVCTPIRLSSDWSEWMNRLTHTPARTQDLLVRGPCFFLRIHGEAVDGYK